MKKILSLALALCLLLSLVACAQKPQTAQLFAMNTVMDLSISGERAGDALAACEKELHAMEQTFSRTLEQSELSAVNRAAGSEVKISRRLYALLQASLQKTAETGGNFDISIAPVASAWGFTEDAYRVPSPAELQALLTKVGSAHIQLREEGGDCFVRLDAGCAIDLGGIAKGYASDELAAILRSFDIPSAKISLGGNVYVCGAKPDGSPWRVAVRDPRDESAMVGVLSLTDSFAVTSGGYERYFEENGKIYHHILDPKTGAPAESGLLSVTIVADSGTRCDALSTALFVMGEEKAADFWREKQGQGETFEMVLVTDDGRVLATAGLEDRFEASEGAAYETIR